MKSLNSLVIEGTLVEFNASIGQGVIECIDTKKVEGVEVEYVNLFGFIISESMSHAREIFAGLKRGSVVRLVGSLSVGLYKENNKVSNDTMISVEHAEIGKGTRNVRSEF